MLQELLLPCAHRTSGVDHTDEDTLLDHFVAPMTRPAEFRGLAAESDWETLRDQARKLCGPRSSCGYASASVTLLLHCVAGDSASDGCIAEALLLHVEPQSRSPSHLFPSSRVATTGVHSPSYFHVICPG